MTTEEVRPIEETDDIIDVRDVIARLDSLRDSEDDDDRDELADLVALMADLEGLGGDEQWEGGRYPATLIRDSYFEDYAREIAVDIGAVNDDYSWPTSHIDWDAAAEALQFDYSSVEFHGVTFWTR